MSNIVCPKCESEISGARVNIATGIAHCEKCDRVFRFDDQLAPARRPDSSVSSSSTALAVSVKPDRFVVTGGELAPSEEVMYRTTSAPVASPLVIRWRWFSPKSFFIIAFAIAWDSFLVVWYATGIAHGGSASTFLFPLAHVAAGVWVTYRALSELFNTTTITLDARELRSVTSPIRNPFKNDEPIARDALVEVGVVERKGNKGSITYALIARDDGGRSLELAVFDERGEADYLTQRLREQLDVDAEPRALTE